MADFGLPKGVYPCGRLDHDSEGLLVLSADGLFARRLTDPRFAVPRTYWAQVERIPAAEALRKLEEGIVIQKRRTLPCRAWLLRPRPELPPRERPVRFRKNVPECWIGLELVEGKNHQVRRMTAAIGHPTLRLIRVQIEDFELGDLHAGQWKRLNREDRRLVMGRSTPARVFGADGKPPGAETRPDIPERQFLDKP